MIIEETSVDSGINALYHVNGYEFITNCEFEIIYLTKEEQKIIDEIVVKFQHFTTKEIINYMHEEEAYKKTKPKEMISYEYAKELSI